MGDAQADIRLIREALGRALSAIRGNANLVEAFRDGTDLSGVGDTIRTEAGHVRADTAAALQSATGASAGQLGKTLGLSKPGAARLIRIGQKRETQ